MGGYVGFGVTDIWTALPSSLELPDIWTGSFRGDRACSAHGWLSDDGSWSCAIADILSALPWRGLHAEGDGIRIVVTLVKTGDVVRFEPAG